MRYIFLIIALFLTSEAAAQEGAIRYTGAQTIKMDVSALMSSLPDGMEADSAMAEMILSQIPAEGIIMPLNFNARFSGQTVVGSFDFSGMFAGMGMGPSLGGGGGRSSMTPFSGALNQMPDLENETYLNYEDGTIIQSVPSFMDEPYIITRSLDEHTYVWEFVDQDSTIQGYSVLHATTVLSTSQIAAVMASMSPDGMDAGGMDMGDEPALFEAWYAPELPSPVGPMNMGGLPGAILRVSGSINLEGMEVQMSLEADSIATTLDKPVAPPTGTPIEFEAYQELMKLRMEMLQQQIRQRQQ